MQVSTVVGNPNSGLWGLVTVLIETPEEGIIYISEPGEVLVLRRLVKLLLGSQSGAMFEHHRWSNPDAADGVEIEYMVHNYTLRGETVIGAYTAGHCAPGGTDAPPNAPWAYFGRFPLRLSCPQPDPTVAEQGVAGQTWSAFFDRHLARGV